MKRLIGQPSPTQTELEDIWQSSASSEGIQELPYDHLLQKIQSAKFKLDWQVNISFQQILQGYLLSAQRGAVEMNKHNIYNLFDLCIVASLHACQVLDHVSLSKYHFHSSLMSLFETYSKSLSMLDLTDLSDYCEARHDWLTRLHNEYQAKEVKIELSMLAFWNIFFKRFPDDAVEMRGRLLRLMANIFDIDSKSGYNVACRFHTENDTIMEEVAPDTQNPFRLPRDSAPVDTELYRTFWSLQKVFSNPRSITSDVDVWRQFRSNLDEVLLAFKNTQIPESDANTHFKVRLDKNGYHPKYLTNSNLFTYQLRDPTLRRNVCVQALILLDAVLMEASPKYSFSKLLDDDDRRWARDTRDKIFKRVLPAINPKGQNFARFVRAVLKRSGIWNLWKYQERKDRCLPLKRSIADTDIPSEEPESRGPARKKQRHSSRRPFFDEQLKTSVPPMGSTELYSIFKSCPKIFQNCRAGLPGANDAARQPKGTDFPPRAGMEWLRVENRRILNDSALLEKHVDRLGSDYQENKDEGLDQLLVSDQRLIFQVLRLLRDVEPSVYSVLCPSAIPSPRVDDLRSDFLVQLLGHLGDGFEISDMITPDDLEVVLQESSSARQRHPTRKTTSNSTATETVSTTRKSSRVKEEKTSSSGSTRTATVSRSYTNGSATEKPSKSANKRHSSRDSKDRPDRESSRTRRTNSGKPSSSQNGGSAHNSPQQNGSKRSGTKRASKSPAKEQSAPLSNGSIKEHHSRRHGEKRSSGSRSPRPRSSSQKSSKSNSKSKNSYTSSRKPTSTSSTSKTTRERTREPQKETQKEHKDHKSERESREPRETRETRETREAQRERGDRDRSDRDRDTHREKRTEEKHRSQRAKGDHERERERNRDTKEYTTDRAPKHHQRRSHDREGRESREHRSSRK